LFFLLLKLAVAFFVPVVGVVAKVVGSIIIVAGRVVVTQIVVLVIFRVMGCQDGFNCIVNHYYAIAAHGRVILNLRKYSLSGRLIRRENISTFCWRFPEKRNGLMFCFPRFL